MLPACCEAGTDTPNSQPNYIDATQLMLKMGYRTALHSMGTVRVQPGSLSLLHDAVGGGKEHLDLDLHCVTVAFFLALKCVQVVPDSLLERLMTLSIANMSQQLGRRCTSNFVSTPSSVWRLGGTRSLTSGTCLLLQLAPSLLCVLRHSLCACSCSSNPAARNALYIMNRTINFAADPDNLQNTGVSKLPLAVLCTGDDLQALDRPCGECPAHHWTRDEDLEYLFQTLR